MELLWALKGRCSGCRSDKDSLLLLLKLPSYMRDQAATAHGRSKEGEDKQEKLPLSGNVTG